MPVTANSLPPDQLFAETYAQLRGLAAAFLRNERPAHTLQPTALVNEAYLKLRAAKPIDYANRRRFLGVAVRAMRQILIDHARRRGANKRAGQSVTLSEGLIANEQRSVDVLDLDRALEALSNVDPDRARIVEFRFFAGLSCEETATILGLSSRTVIRQWRSSRAFLLNALGDAETGASP